MADVSQIVSSDVSDFPVAPADIHAARANSLPVIAVATGIYTHEQLAAEVPSLCIRSFADLI